MADHEGDKCIFFNPEHNNEQDTDGKCSHNIRIHHRDPVCRLYCRTRYGSGIKGTDGSYSTEHRGDQRCAHSKQDRTYNHIFKFFRCKECHIIVKRESPDRTDRRRIRKAVKCKDQHGNIHEKCYDGKP